jgi:hypothetical protein
VSIDVKCVVKQNGLRVGAVSGEESHRSVADRVGFSLSSGYSLYIRIEMRGLNINRGIFEVRGGYLHVW